MKKVRLLKVIQWSVIIIYSISYFLFLYPFIRTNTESFLTKKALAKDSTVRNYLTELKYQDESVSHALSGLSEVDSKLFYNDISEFSFSDPRILAMRKFLKDYGSPMYPYADVFIYEADKYGLDWRLVAAISGVESAFGNIIPPNSNNAWGWRGGPGGAWSIWPSWGEGIATVTRGLAIGYGTHLTPFQIESTYCPPCGENPAHPWANGVQSYMNQLNSYLNNLDN